VPAYDLKTLWVVNNAEGSSRGSVVPIDPATGRPGAPIAVDDPYNMYFTPDGHSAIVVVEALKRLDFRDPQTMALQASLPTPGCAGINHADFAIDGRFAIFTCEFNGSLVKIDIAQRRVVAYLRLSRGSVAQAPHQDGADPVCRAPVGRASMPQDIRISPDGKLFYVADMMADGVVLVDGESFQEVGFIPTGIGAHGLYPSRDGTRLYVSNRGSHALEGRPKGHGSVAVIDFASRRVESFWPIFGGGSPDMGNVSADGRQLWLSGRFDDVVYVFDTRTGRAVQIPVGREPHGLTVWPQPGRYSLGHTGNMR
jgi:DNA-binding beta-propeller fold protein YncE